VRPFVSVNVPILTGEGVFLMGSTLDKASGLANEAIGKIKQGLGSAVGSDKLKGEGAAQELKGHAQQAVEDAKAAAAADDRESKIRERAHRIWQEEGSPEGRAHSHWHQAEREVDAEEAARKLSELKGD
jgi:uncharacterized protein YjbJ (UPF0337 family)